ncbi:UNVERIFIED_CONTAM: hypothetical protein Sindi_0102400 [Sesamum indicum]
MAPIHSEIAATTVKEQRSSREGNPTKYNIKQQNSSNSSNKSAAKISKNAAEYSQKNRSKQECSRKFKSHEQTAAKFSERSRKFVEIQLTNSSKIQRTQQKIR